MYNQQQYTYQRPNSISSTSSFTSRQLSSPTAYTTQQQSIQHTPIQYNPTIQSSPSNQQLVPATTAVTSQDEGQQLRMAHRLIDQYLVCR